MSRFIYFTSVNCISKNLSTLVIPLAYIVLHKLAMIGIIEAENNNVLIFQDLCGLLSLKSIRISHVLLMRLPRKNHGSTSIDLYVLC